MKEDHADGIYLFGFARALSAAAIQGVGIDDEHPILLHRSLDVTAVISHISLNDFCVPSGERNMKDISWIGPRAVRHEKMVERIMQHSPVFPARFGTIFSTLNRLEDLLQIHQQTILRFLDKVAGKAEWSIKGFIDGGLAKDKLYTELLSTQAGRLSELSPGARYFEEKRFQGEADRQLKGWLNDAVKRVDEELARYASDICDRRPLAREMTGRDMVMNWAYLIPQASATDCRIQVDRVNETYEPRGFTLTVSGPWPPYSFCPTLDSPAHGEIR